MSATPKVPSDHPILRFKSQAAWGAWLDKHHGTSRGVWLSIAKVSSGIASVSYDEALDMALCYGWIDGQKQSHDTSSWLQKFTPRASRSIWSKRNREKAQQLIRGGRMKPAGLREVARAKRDGRWDAAYDSPRQAGVPSDLQASLDNHPKAKAFFATLDSRNRYAILHRLQTARRAESRASRIEQFIGMLAKRQKLYQ